MQQAGIVVDGTEGVGMVVPQHSTLGVGASQYNGSASCQLALIAQHVAIVADETGTDQLQLTIEVFFSHS